MSSAQAVKPLVGEEGILPTLVVRPTTATSSARSLAQDAAQTPAYPTVQVREDVPMTMTKESKPSLQRRAQRPDDTRQAVPVGTDRLGPDRVLELGQTFLPRQPKHAPKGVAQKVKAVRPRVHDLRLGRMQRQAGVFAPLLHLRQGLIRFG